jgi:tetratricopeptide (TPR) repeat protein
MVQEGGHEVIRSVACISIAVFSLMFQGSQVFLYSQADKEGKEEEGPGAYQEVLEEKVGEVAEYRYKGYVESKADLGDGDQALLRLALYRYFLGDYAGSEFYLRRLVKRFEESELVKEAKLWMGRTYLARGELRAALVELREGLKRLEDSENESEDLIGRYLFWIGECYLRNQKIPEARDYFAQLAEKLQSQQITSIPKGRFMETCRSLGMRNVIESLDGGEESISTTDPSRQDTAKTHNKAFFVQVGSFSARENAVDLVLALKDVGFTAEIHPVEVANGLYYRVMLGGFESRGKAEDIAGKVMEEGYGKTIIEERK